MWAWEMGEEVEVEDAREWVGVEVGSGERFMMGNVVEEVLLVGVEERLDVVVAMFAGKEKKDTASANEGHVGRLEDWGALGN